MGRKEGDTEPRTTLVAISLKEKGDLGGSLLALLSIVLRCKLRIHYRGRRKMEVLLIILLTLATIPLALLATGPLRVVVGILFLLFIPGYTLVAALFPRKNSLDAIERIALSTGLSIAIVALTGLALNYTPWGIHLRPVLISITSFTLVFSAVVIIRRLRLPRDERFEPRVRIRPESWREMGRANKVLSIMFVVLILTAIAAVAYAAATLRAGEKFTEFYALGMQGTADNYPSKLQMGQAGEVTLGVVNHERQDTSYRLEIRIDRETVQVMGPISLADGEKWEGKLVFEPTKAGQGQELDLWLYIGQGSEPYRELRLWLDVEEAK